MIRQFSGIYPMLYSFFNTDGSFDRGAMKAQVDHVVDAGAHGIGILGLVSEVFKLDLNERLRFVELSAELNAGRRPLAVTVAEPSVQGQVAFARAAKAAGASWLIIQLPSFRGATERDYVAFVGAVAGQVDLPVAVQNNPVNMDVFVSNDALFAMHENHPNITMLKAEGSAVTTAPLAQSGKLGVFGGRNGMELIANLKAGCVGNVPAAEMAGPLARIYDLATAGTPEAAASAEDLYRTVLPLIVFINQNLPTQLCYGKRMLADLAGIRTIVERPPNLKPTPFGMAMLRDFAQMAGLPAAKG